MTVYDLITAPLLGAAIHETVAGNRFQSRERGPAANMIGNAHLASLLRPRRDWQDNGSYCTRWLLCRAMAKGAAHEMVKEMKKALADGTKTASTEATKPS